MQKYLDRVVSRGLGVSGASVRITTQAGANASLFSDDGVTPRNNPVITDAAGYFEFYAADGMYIGYVSIRGYRDSIFDFSLLAPRPVFGTRIQGRDMATIAAYTRNGGARMVTLGDSIKAGIGSTDSSPYGECAGMLNQADTNLFAYSLMYADPNFIKPTDEIYPLQLPFVTGGSTGAFNPLGSLPLPNWQLTKSKAGTIALVIHQDYSIASSDVSVYYLERYSTAAATCQVRAYDAVAGTLLDTWTIDTWCANPTFTGVGAVTVQGRIAKLTRTLPATARSIRLVFDSTDVISREGAAVAADGTAVLFGVTVGKGISFRNLAVSSTTLLDSSADNVSRGITTAERLAKAQAFGANVFFIGWGTNDSKTGVSSVAAYRVQFAALIAAIRAFSASAVIVLCTAPRGLAAPYNNNYLYNAAMRDVAAIYNTSLIDYEDVAAGSPAYNDDVHPTRLGYDQMGAALCAAFGIRTFRSYFPEQSLDDSRFTRLATKNIAGGVSDFTGVASTITTLTVNRMGSSALRIRLSLVFASTTAFNASIIRIKASGYAGLDGSGALVGAAKVVNEAVFSEPLVSGTAILPYSVERVLAFSALETRSVVITVEGVNWGLRNANATHSLEVEALSLALAP